MECGAIRVMSTYLVLAGPVLAVTSHESGVLVMGGGDSGDGGDGGESQGGESEGRCKHNGREWVL